MIDSSEIIYFPMQQSYRLLGYVFIRFCTLSVTQLNDFLHQNIRLSFIPKLEDMLAEFHKT